MLTDFNNDLKRGKIGEEIFIDDFLEFLRINYQDVTGSQAFQIIDNDFLASIGRYEIKTNYKDDGVIIIEEFTNINADLAPISKGWFYKSKTDMLVFVSRSTRDMILIPFTDKFKLFYESIKEKSELRKNLTSVSNGRKWQSAYRRIPLEALNGFYAYYTRKVNKASVTRQQPDLFGIL